MMELLGEPELQEMVAQDVNQQVRCEFCARAYNFAAGEIDTLIK